MAYKIPLFDLHYGEDEHAAVLRTIESKWISMGPNVRSMEEYFETHLGVANAIAVTNGTAALHLALRILDVKEGDEVIVPSLTFVATVNAVRYVGATPVFADIQSNEDFSIAPSDVTQKITPRTKAIIVMHYAGFMCDMNSILAIARQHSLFVIEDAAHAPASESKDGKAGSMGDVGCFSLFSNKNVTCGEGGVLVTQNDEYARLARLLRSHGMTTVSFDRATGHASAYDVVELGYNYRIDDIRGALALAQLRRLKTDVEKRRLLREHYLRELGQLGGIIVPYRDRAERTSNYIFPVVLKSGDAAYRDLVRRRLADKGIETSVHYPAVHRFSTYRAFASDLPNTNYVADHEITLPLYYKLTTDNVSYISNALRYVL